MTDPDPSIRVLVVDDHTLFRHGLRLLLGTLPGVSVAGEAADGESAIELFRQQKPDVTLVDLRMPGLDGVETIGRIKEEFPGARFLILTTYEGDEDIHRALRAGAQGYLLKHARGNELLAAIRTVYAGARYLPPALASRLRARNDRPTLTDREREVLALMARGLRNREIGSALAISLPTVKSHVNAILAKLGVEARTEAVVEAIQLGIVKFD